VTREDYQGVHTTSDLVIAAAYAQGAAQKTGDEPVVIVLNTKGLDALADVDVTLEAARTLDDRAIRNEFAMGGSSTDAIPVTHGLTATPSS
jgi:hypothetical protein